MTDEDEEFNRIEREASLRKAAVSATVRKKHMIEDDDDIQDYVGTKQNERDVRNQTLEEVAREFDKMKSLGDTAASFAAYVRNMKK
jgi:hypothetical protein